MKPLIAAIVVMMFASSANAQGSVSTAVVKAQSTEAPTLQATNESADPLSIQKVLAISRAAERATIAGELPALAQKMVSEQGDGATELLRAGQVLELAESASAGTNALQQRSINVRVKYDARPVGGILNIRVELIPIFGGIGSAVRPTISREFAEAVNDFDDDFIGQTIVKLTDELAAEYAAK
ncbi:MAG TPA: hypothetical protein VFH95_11035 [Candidatus Kapabacteria bacterium]|nr:hypothetical protein [Candidatus Kapabacteria bacterium]